jgi:uncharacterized cupredoxin-like copper-binding protein
MKRLDRRKFMVLASVGSAGAVLTACGNDPDDTDLNPTMIPDLEGAPPTLAPYATPGGGATEGDEEGEGGEEGSGGATAVEVTAVDVSFEPKALTIAADTDVTITVTNDGALQHDFVIEDTDFATELIDGGGNAELVVNLPAGEYTYFCSVPGHREAGMEGTLTVTAESAAAEGEASPAAEGEASPAAEPVAEEGDAGAAGATAVEVSAVELAFDPKELAIAADTDVTITLTNNGVLQHDLVIEDTDFATELIDGGASAELVVNLPAGEYTYFCSVPGHRESGMEGTLTAS